MDEQKTIGEQTKGEEKNLPLYKTRFGGITGTAWENEKKFKSFTLNKVYKDIKTGEFKYTNSLSLNDLPKAILCLQELYKKETQKNSEDK